MSQLSSQSSDSSNFDEIVPNLVKLVSKYGKIQIASQSSFKRIDVHLDIKEFQNVMNDMKNKTAFYYYNGYDECWKNIHKFITPYDEYIYKNYYSNRGREGKETLTLTKLYSKYRNDLDQGKRIVEMLDIGHH